MNELGPRENRKPRKESSDRQRRRDSKDTKKNTELFAKEVYTAPKILYPREILSRSVSEAHALAEEVLTGISPYRMKDLMKVGFEEGNMRRLAERLEPQKDRHGEVIATCYYQAASGGDEIASDRLGELLDTEQQRTKQDVVKEQTEGRIYEYTNSPMIQSVIEQCAERGEQPDEWINAYAADKNHRAHLMLTYYTKTPDEYKERVQHYRDEVTKDFILDNNMSREFAFENAERIWQLQTDPLIKQALIGRVKEFPQDPLRYETFKKLCDFSSQALSDPDMLEEDDKDWLEERMADYGSKFIKNGFDHYDVLKKLFLMTLAREKNAPTDFRRTCEKIDFMTSKMISIDIPNSHQEDKAYTKNDQAMILRNAALRELSRNFALKGDFVTARACIDEIFDEDSRTRALIKRLHDAKTQEDVDSLFERDIETSDDTGFTRLVYAPNDTVILARKMKEAIMHGDTQTSEDIAQKFIADPAFSDEETLWTALKMGIIESYEHDHLLGVKLTQTVRELFQEHDIDPLRNSSLSHLQIEYGDPAGLITIYKNAESETSKQRRLEKYAEVALLTKEFLAKNKTANVDQQK